MHRMSGFMLTVSPAGFLIAKQGGFLQLACWVLQLFHFWPRLPFIGVLLLNDETINNQFTVFKLFCWVVFLFCFFFSMRSQDKNYILNQSFPWFLFVTISITPLLCIILQPTVYSMSLIAIKDLILSFLLLLN